MITSTPYGNQKTPSPNIKFSGKITHHYGDHQPYSYDKYLERCKKNRIKPEQNRESQVSYVFNQKGYRSDEFDKQADFTLLVVGSSISFGTGIRWDDTYPVVISKQLSPDYAVFNLSDGGASNAYISRCLLEYLDDLKPSLVVVQFAEIWRYEYIDHKGNFINVSKNTDDTVVRVVKSHLDKIHNENMDLFNFYKELLLVQEFLKNRRQKYIIFGGGSGHKALHVNNNIVKPFRDHVDFSKVYLGNVKHMDLSLDFHHPGPLSHKKFAYAILDLIKRIYDTNSFSRRTMEKQSHEIL